MRNIITVLIFITLFACNSAKEKNNAKKNISKKGEISMVNITNEKMINYPFLKGMYNDGYFPNHLVDKGKSILIRLCVSIENQKPQNLEELYKLTHAATEEFNNLAEEFYENDSEIETVARECIGMDFANIALNYGYDADVEELIATRDW